MTLGTDLRDTAIWGSEVISEEKFYSGSYTTVATQAVAEIAEVASLRTHFLGVLGVLGVLGNVW
jgi:hypothetical protein